MTGPTHVQDADRIVHGGPRPAVDVRATDARPAPGPALARQSIRGLRQLERRDLLAPLPDDVRDPGSTTPASPAREASVGLLAQLRAAVTLHVVALRSEGLPPEQMLPRAKAMLREALAAEGWRDPIAAQVLMASVVRWSIEAYFDR